MTLTKCPTIDKTDKKNIYNIDCCSLVAKIPVLNININFWLRNSGKNDWSLLTLSHLSTG